MFVCVYNMSMSRCDVPGFSLCTCQVFHLRFTIWFIRFNCGLTHVLYFFFFFVKLTKPNQTILGIDSFSSQKKTAPKLFDTPPPSNHPTKERWKIKIKALEGGKEYFFFCEKEGSCQQEKLKQFLLFSMLTTTTTTFLHFF